MQDIVFYAVANETLGCVRDYANARKKPAPILTLGVSVCLRMRLFAAQNDATPYPMDSFNGIVDWQWRMDDDFDRNTTCKVVADAGSISVHTANGTFDGGILHFTEFLIPISDMNTQELATWIGNGKRRSGLTGELVGYDNAGNAVFVLQIENFTIRNRVGGLGDPTALDQEAVTRTQAESLIQAAVSASADTKQDKLNSSNAGTGISISSNGVISTANVPQSAVTGLSASFAAKQDNISAGDLMEISGNTVNRKRYMNIIADSGIITRTITPEGSQTSVSAYVLEPGNAYKINVTSSAKWLATTAAFKDSTGTWGIEAHIELFVAGTGYVRTDSNVALANALEPDAVNNCTVRFHDGLAIISVEDHVAGYIVTVNAASGAGSLSYGLATSTNEYIAVDASLNGQTLDLAGATTYAGEKHVVGNGYTETVLSGGIVCTSKTTFSNLSMNGVVHSGGSMVLGDVNIPSNATLTLLDSGANLYPEKVVGDGTIDLNSYHAWLKDGAIVSNVTVSNGHTTDSVKDGGAFYVQNASSPVLFEGVRFVSNTAARHGGAFSKIGGALVTVKNCIFDGNKSTSTQYAPFEGAIYVGSGTVDIDGGTFGDKQGIGTGANATVTMKGTVKTLGRMSGTITLTSGAVIDLTGNTNSTVAEGGITFEPGGAIVYPSAGQASAYMLDNLTVASLSNTNYLNKLVQPYGGKVSGAIFSGLANSFGGAVQLNNSTFEAEGCSFYDNTCLNNKGGAMYLAGCTASVSNCVFSGNAVANWQDGLAICMGSNTNGSAHCMIGDCDFQGVPPGGSKGSYFIYINGGGTAVFSGTNINPITKVVDGELTITSGAIVDLTGTSAGTPIIANAENGIINIVGGGDDLPTVIRDSAGHIHTFDYADIQGSTITNLGFVYGAAVTFLDSTADYLVYYTTDDGTTYSSATVNGSTGTYTVTGALVQLNKVG